MLYLFILATLSFFCCNAAAAGAGNITGDVEGFAPSWVKEPDGRGSWKIIYSATFTMFLCAYTSLHLNIPPSDETWGATTKRILAWVTLSFTLPEYIIFLAIMQWFRAREFRKNMNATVAVHAASQKASSIAKAPTKPLTTLYAWFVIMGGFRVDISTLHNTIDTATLTPEGILFLAKHGHTFHISDDEISDKSKADYLAKGLVAFQVLWFVADLVQRKLAGLPICLLEFHTLVNIACWFVTYAMWFAKPLNIKTPVVVGSTDIEQLLAVLVFRAELVRRPKYLSRFQTRWKISPVEMEMWAWTNDNRMVVNFDAVESSLKPSMEVNVTPAGKQAVERTLRHGDVMESRKERATTPQTPANLRNEAPSQQARNAGRDMFKLSISEKDYRRLALVRAYTEGHIARPPIAGSAALSSPIVDSEGNLIPSLSQAAPQPVLVSSTSVHTTATASARSSIIALHAQSIDLEMQNNLPLNQPHCAAISTTHPKQCTQHQDWSDTFCIVLHLFGVPKYGLRHTTSYSDIEDLVISWTKRDKRSQKLSQLLPISLLIVPAVYSAIHLIPDLQNWTFPTETERLLWRIACYEAISLPAPMLLIIILGLLFGMVVGILLISSRIQEKVDKIDKMREGTIFSHDRNGRSELLWPKWSLVVGIPFIVFWLAARLFLLVEAFISLRREKVEVFQTPEWNWLDIVPHV